MAIGNHTMQKYKSKLESTFAKTFKLPYEKDKINYTIEHTYNPDWTVAENVFLETKGIFDFEDRRKTLAVKKQHPHITVALVFQNSKAKIYKGSKTTYAEWCNKHNVIWFDIKDQTGIRGFINNHVS